MSKFWPSVAAKASVRAVSAAVVTPLADTPVTRRGVSGSRALGSAVPPRLEGPQQLGDENGFLECAVSASLTCWGAFAVEGQQAHEIVAIDPRIEPAESGPRQLDGVSASRRRARVDVR